MKPVVGEISYKDMSPEDVARFVHEAEVMRAQAVRAMFVGAVRAVGHAFSHAAHGFRAILANPGIHPSAGAR